MVKKVVSAFICIIMVLSSSLLVYAEEPNDCNIIQPYYEYTRNNAATLNIDNGVSTCGSTITGYPNKTTKVTITMYLEKKTLWWWNTQASWAQTFDGYYGALSKTHAVSGGTYRIRAVYIAYSENQSETITGYSSEMKY